MTFLMACLVEVEAPPERRHEGRHHAPRRTLDHETVAARVRLASILAVAVACLYSLLDLVRALI